MPPLANSRGTYDYDRDVARRGRKEEIGVDEQVVELFLSRRIGSEQEGETRVLRLGEHVARCNGKQLISQPVKQ